MNRHLSILIAGLLLAVAVVGANAQAAPQRTGVVINVHTPGGLTLPVAELTASVLRQVHDTLQGIDRVFLVEQDVLVSAQERLGITLSAKSKARDIRALSRALDLKHLIVLEVTVGRHFDVALAATVFNPDGTRAFFAALRVEGSELDRALGRAVKGVFELVLPALA